MQFSQICGRVDVEAESGPIHNRRSRALLPVEHKAIPSESEAERIGVPERHRICAAVVPIRRKAQPRSSAAASRVWTSCTVRCGKSAWITSKGRLPNCARARANSGLRPPPLSGNQRDGHSDTSVGARRYREPIAFTLDRQVITRAAIADASAMRSVEFQRFPKSRLTVDALFQGDKGGPVRHERKLIARSSAACATRILSSRVVIRVAQRPTTTSGASQRSPLSIKMASISPA